ncbi:MAG: DUF4124 domain-containing protein [Candidatus Manganitrophus sp.]|nr:DUF4124 domain-containing protein [Candidatus Manganitrophus sp.]WDT70589.1 MAG: DUF4124 domain-containing protein [Candidatus Manganitrophus sp.]
MIFSKTMLILLLLLTPSKPSAMAGEIFRWLDEDGTPHFTNVLSRIPPAYREHAEVQPLPDLPVVKSIAPLVSIPRSANVDLNGHDERWWKRRIQEWRSREGELIRQLTEAEKALGRLRFENKTIFFREAETNRLLREIEAMKQEVRKAEEALQTALPEAARKASAPPGWLR